MTENKQFVYVLSTYIFYGSEVILGISSSNTQIMSWFDIELKKLVDDNGLIIRRFELGKLYDERFDGVILHVEKEDGKVKVLSHVNENMGWEDLFELLLGENTINE